MGKKHLANPFLFWMYFALLIICLLISCFGFGLYFPHPRNPDGTVNGAIVVGIAGIANIFIIIMCGRHGLSYYEIRENQLSLYAPFRKTLHLDLSECKDVGIDYAVLSDGRMLYWLYFSKEPIPRKYLHRINQLKYSSHSLRLQYTEETFHNLVEVVSPSVRRRLENAYSVIQNRS